MPDREALISESATYASSSLGSSAARHVAVSLGWEGMETCISRVYQEGNWTPARLPLPGVQFSADKNEMSTKAQDLLVVKHPKVRAALSTERLKRFRFSSYHFLPGCCCDCMPDECSLLKHSVWSFHAELVCCNLLWQGQYISFVSWSSTGVLCPKVCTHM